MTQVNAGWYPDPSGDPSKLRYWDGVQWTDNYSDARIAQPVTSNNDEIFFLVAFIFMLLSTIATGLLIVPLFWMIPMTVHCWRVYKGTKPNTTVFGVCTLIFVNLIAGIFLLVATKQDS